MTSHRDHIVHYFRLRPGEWVPGEILASPEIGGAEFTRRIRELRADGYNIAMRARFGGRAEYRLIEDMTRSATYQTHHCPACGFTAEEPVFTHAFHLVLCPKCGGEVA